MARLLPEDFLEDDEREVVDILGRLFCSDEETTPAVRILAAHHVLVGWWRERKPPMPFENYELAFDILQGIYGQKPEHPDDTEADAPALVRHLAYLLLLVTERLRPPGSGPEPCAYAASMAWKLLQTEIRAEDRRAFEWVH